MRDLRTLTLNVVGIDRSGLRRFLSESWPSSRGRDRVLEFGEKIGGKFLGSANGGHRAEPRSVRKKQKPIEQIQSRLHAVTGAII